MNTGSVALSNINVKFQNKALFNCLDFEIHQGQNWAITGKSGSGKSVLLQTIAGNIGINGGSIVYHFMADVHQMHPDTDALLTFHRFIAFAGAKHHFKTLSNTADFYYQQRYNSSDSEDTLTVHDYLQSVKVNNH